MMEATDFVIDEITAYISEFPIYQYAFSDPTQMDFNERVRYICETECERYGTSWSCPPAVGDVATCEKKCKSYSDALVFSTVAEVQDVLNFEETMKTKYAHEEITNAIVSRMHQLGCDCYVLSSDSCAICESCAYPDGQKCRHPEHMHPCIESHGIVVASLTEKLEMDYYLDEHTFLWFSIVFFKR